MTAAALGVIDKSGRRPLLLYGVTLMVGSLVMISLAFALPKGGGSALVLIATCVFVAAYAISYGPITWLVTSEMFPTSVRGRALGIGTVANGIGSVLVSFSFLPMVDRIGEAGTFLVYACICFAAVIFILVFVPETRLRETTQIYDDLQSTFVSTTFPRWARHMQPLRSRASGFPLTPDASRKIVLFFQCRCRYLRLRDDSVPLAPEDSSRMEALPDVSDLQSNGSMSINDI